MSGSEPTRRSLRLQAAAGGALDATAKGAGAAAASSTDDLLDADAPPAVPTPAAVGGRKTRQPPVDIGISALLLGGGALAAAAADSIDQAPLGSVGFTMESLRAGCDFLRKSDPKLVPLIDLHGPPERLLRKRGSNFATLAKAIVFQQLATQAAAKIYGRVLGVCGCTEALAPQAVLAAPAADLRGAGLSERKAAYIQDLASHFADGRLSDAKVEAMSESELEAELLNVRGIGVWTCQMHAMFHLGSPDVVPTGDLGVRRGMQQLYGLKELPSPAKMHEIAKAWRPYASLGSYFMWKVEVPRGKKEKRAAPNGGAAGGKKKKAG